MQNTQLADVFDEMADLLEISGESPFRIRAYRTGSQVIRDFPESIEKLVREQFDLTTLEGIGKTLAEKSVTLVTTGKLPALEQLRLEVPPSLRDLLRVPGLGAKKVAALFKELGVTNLRELQEACEKDQVKSLKGFGAKTQNMILEGLAIAEEAGKRLLLDSAEALVERLRSHMRECSAVKQIEFAGSYRRHKETIGDIDVLITSDEPTMVMKHFVGFPGVREVIAQGETKSSIRVADAFQVDLRVVESESFGAALQYFTGSKEHNVALRGMAKKKGLKINEYGVFRMDDESQAIAGATEEGVYQAIGLDWIAPEFRENRFEWEPDLAKHANSIIQLSDIQGDLHMHTTATDGKNSIEEMARQAQSRGLKYIAITDHSQRVSMARGLTAERVLEQWREIDELNQKWKGEGFVVLKGIECDILENGEMDLPDSVLEQADWVMASIHYGQKQTREQITDRILNAIRNPFVSAISHPTGRLLGRRDAYEVDLNAIFQAAVEFDKPMEINAHPMRLDLSDVNCLNAAAMNVQFVINTDAHSIEELDLMQFGIFVARRAGLRASQVRNTLPVDKLSPQRR